MTYEKKKKKKKKKKKRKNPKFKLENLNIIISSCFSFNLNKLLLKNNILIIILTFQL